jgi:hypothetical protein
MDRKMQSQAEQGSAAARIAGEIAALAQGKKR